MRLPLPFAGLLIGAAALMAAGAAAQSPEPSDPELADAELADAELRYGAALYHYYQQDYLEALSELMVAQERGGIETRGDNPRLIEGGIRLAFGMPDSAGVLFEQVLETTRTPAQRDAAWFYLGKLHYLRGDWSAAAERLARPGEHLERDLARERRALEVNLRIRAGESLPAASPDNIDLGHWTPYVLYNLGAARARAGEPERARDYYEALADFKPAREPGHRREHLALRDKALTAAGYTYLLEQNYARALAQFRRVRLSHSEANQALLGYGWAALEAGDYAEALKPWQALSERSLIHAPVQEAQLALPYAYEQLGAKGEALSTYDRAEQNLERELALVERLRRSLNRTQLLAALRGASDAEELVSVAPEGEHNWLTLDRASVINTRSSYLAELFRQNAFQTRVQSLRDLVSQRALLADWQPKLAIYAQLLRDKKAQRGQREQQLERRALLTQVEQLARRRDQLVQRLERLEAERDFMALADAESRELYAMTESARESLRRLEAAGEDAGEHTGDAAGRLRLYRGILLWRAAQAFPDRLWQSEKTRRQLDSALEDLRERTERVREITATDLDIEPSLARLAAQSERIDAQMEQLDAALDRNLDRLAEQVGEHLDRHRERLNRYLAQTRLAAARLQDDALREVGP